MLSVAKLVSGCPNGAYSLWVAKMSAVTSSGKKSCDTRYERSSSFT